MITGTCTVKVKAGVTTWEQADLEGNHLHAHGTTESCNVLHGGGYAFPMTNHTLLLKLVSELSYIKSNHVLARL